ncbi:hypothetical protein EUX98_g1353 [Antrodiella citrinella]|uniref:Uncharacterized protein n=1 Tax=Antrodiella citrinella TaxID=2447956 RepID=A0A4S4N1S4_9APHY|nr:hypothetical protein EUX98_g1353 [Antrodiella citrinella]
MYQSPPIVGRRLKSSSPLPALKVGVANTTTTFKKLSANAFAISSFLSAMGGPGPLQNTSVDWTVAQTGWQVPVNAAVADLVTLATISNAFVTAMGTVLNATSESARTDPVWTVLTSVTTAFFTYEAAFTQFLITTQSYATSYDAASAAAGTSDGAKTDLDAYPALTTAAANSLQYLKEYKSRLSEDVSSVLLWAGQTRGAGPVIDLPRVLAEYKETGNSDYSIAAIMLTQLSTVNFTTTNVVPT